MDSYNKILLIASEFPPGPGGIGNHGYNLAKYFTENSFSIKVLSTSDFVDEAQEKKFDEEQNFDIIRFKRFSNKIKTYKERIKIILQTLKHENFSHIIYSGRFPLMASLFLKRYHKNINFIAIAHGGDIAIDNFFEKFLVNRALLKMDLIICVSNYSKSKLPAGINYQKVTVIPNGFDFMNMDQIPINKKVLTNGSINLVTVGTVWPRKGHHNVLNALPGLISDFPGIKYNIIGRIADLSKIKDFLDDKKFAEHVNIHGLLSDNDMHEVLMQSEIFILLSESQSSGDFEGFGIAVLEANYFGLPAVGSKNCGLEDSINNGVSGILVDPHNRNEIAEAVKRIVANYRDFSDGAKTWSLEHHWSKIILRYIESINNIK